MKITVNQLRQLIKEEVGKAMSKEYALTFKAGRFVPAQDQKELALYGVQPASKEQAATVQAAFNAAMSDPDPIGAARKLNRQFLGVHVFGLEGGGVAGPGNALAQMRGALYDDEGYLNDLE